MSKVKTEYWLSTRKVAERLDVAPRTVARWIRNGELKAVKIGRVWRVAGSEVRRFAERGTKE